MESKKYRVGRKQGRIILSWDGTEEIAFVKGNEKLAQYVVDILNGENSCFEDAIKEIEGKRQERFSRDNDFFNDGLNKAIEILKSKL